MFILPSTLHQNRLGFNTLVCAEGAEGEEVVQELQAEQGHVYPIQCHENLNTCAREDGGYQSSLTLIYFIVITSCLLVTQGQRKTTYPFCKSILYRCSL